MKAFFRVCSIVLVLVMVLTGCSSASSTRKNGDQEAFLKDLAEGLKESCEILSNPDENIDEFTNLKNWAKRELKRLEKYNDVVFEDKRFNTLVHALIDGWQLDLATLELGGDMTSYKELMNRGWNTWGARADIISIFYKQYGLDVTRETILPYLQTAEANDLYCSSGASETQTENDNVETTFEVTRIYEGGDFIGMEVMNTSSVYIDVNIQLTLYDGNGNVIGVPEDSFYGLTPQEKGVIIFGYLDPYSTYSYTAGCNRNEWAEAQPRFSYEYNVINKKIIVTATNDSPISTEWIGVKSILLYHGEPVDYHTEPYVSDVDGVIEGYSSFVFEIDTFDCVFDDFILYFSDNY